MYATYIASDTTAGDAQALGDSGRDVFLKKLIFGAPADGKIAIVYNKKVAYGHASGIGSVDSSNVAAKITQPTAAAGKDYVRMVDFTGPDCQGLPLDGGSIHTDGSQVTAVWDYADSQNT